MWTQAVAEHEEYSQCVQHADADEVGVEDGPLVWDLGRYAGCDEWRYQRAQGVHCVDEAEEAMGAVDGRDEGVRVGFVVCHSHGLDEEGDDIEAEWRRPEAESVGEDLDDGSECENGA